MLRSVALGALLLMVGSVTNPGSSRAEPPTESSETQRKISDLLQRFSELTPAELEAMDTIPARRFELPEAGVDVMRAIVTETYTVDGVGTDSVELRGWIAVRHSRPRPAPGADEATWGNAIIDTEFLAMDLRGHSDIFGPVHVHLDPTTRSLGHVGSIDDASCYIGQLKGISK